MRSTSGRKGFWVWSVVFLGLLLAARAWADGPDPVHLVAAGRPLEGLVEHPAGPGPFPAVLDLHGSGWNPSKNVGNLRFWSAHGFVALDVDYLQDVDAVAVPQVLAALAYLRTRPDVDARRIALHGFSLGARVALQVAVRAPEIAVASVVSGRVHLWDGTSPVLDGIGRWPCPVLIQHGRRDEVVPMQEAVDLARALRDHSDAFEMYLYEGEGHRLDTRPEVLARAVRFVEHVVAEN